VKGLEILVMHNQEEEEGRWVQGVPLPAGCRGCRCLLVQGVPLPAGCRGCLCLLLRVSPTV